MVVGLDLPGIDIVDWCLGRLDCHTDHTSAAQAAPCSDQTEPAAVVAVADIAAAAEAVDIVVDWDPHHHPVAHTAADFEPAENYYTFPAEVLPQLVGSEEEAETSLIQAEALP